MISRSRFSIRIAALLATALVGAQAHAIVGGAADTTTSVYRYMGLMSNGMAGTPIAPNWFVTANHIHPNVGDTFSNVSGAFNIDQVVNVTNTAGDPNGLTGATDISLVHITGSFGTNYYRYAQAVTGTAPAANGTGGANGTTVSLVGYGDRSPAIGTAAGANPTRVGNDSQTGRYVATNSVDLLMSGTFDGTNTWAAYTFDLDDNTAAHNITGSMVGTASEGGIANGDSGGGWFVNAGGPLPVIVAVSSGIGSQQNFNNQNGGDNFVAGAFGIGVDLGYYATAITRTTGVAPVPEPAPLAALGLGALAFLRRRRK